jgi:hypothetical protein
MLILTFLFVIAALESKTLEAIRPGESFVNI